MSDTLTRAERRMLKMAYAATERKPLHIVNGPKALMQKCAEKLIDKRLLRLVSQQFFAVVLTDEGFSVALGLRRQGWPDTDPPRPHSPKGE